MVHSQVREAVGMRFVRVLYEDTVPSRLEWVQLDEFVSRFRALLPDRLFEQCMGYSLEYTVLLITLLRRNCLLNCLSFYVRTSQSFGNLGSLRETSLGLLKVDGVPNRAKVLLTSK